MMAERTDTKELSLLGGFVFSVGGDALLGISGGSQRLIAFLALREEAVTRDQVVGTSWQESTDGPAGAGLGQLVSRLDGPLRQAVRVTATDLGLAEDVVVDLHHSRSLARRLIDGDIAPSGRDIAADAVAALSGELLPGWYEDWAVIAAEDWRQLRRRALEAMAARLTAAERFPEAVAAAGAAVGAEPLRESAWAALIRAHLAGGGEPDALEEFERYRVLLHAELGIEPTPRLSQLLCGLEPR